jgi:hypothetical protein
VVLEHPITARPALYGLNSSTCMLVPKGAPVPQHVLDECDRTGVEHGSTAALRGWLPTVTSPTFTVCWQWKAGDVVVWDNRSTIHAGTGYDHRHPTVVREMWRVTLADDLPL